MASALQVALADPDYVKFVGMSVADAFACLPPEKVDSFLQAKEYQEILTPERLANIAAEWKAADEEKEREDRDRVLSLLRLPASRETTQYFRTNLDSPYFSRWRKSYAKLVDPIHIKFVDSVRKGKPAFGYEFFFDDSLGPVKRNYPKNRKSADFAVENRKKVYDFVAANQRATDEEISNSLGIKIGTVKGVIKWLRTNGYLETVVWRKNSLVNPGTSAYAWCNHRVFSCLKPLGETL
jgi:hypothetical protein